MKRLLPFCLSLLLLLACSTPASSAPEVTAEPSAVSAVEQTVEITPSPVPSAAPTLEPTDTPEPTEPPTPTPEPTPEGLCGGRYPEMFAPEPTLDVENRVYKSPTIGVKITTTTVEKTYGKIQTYHVADIYVQDVTSIKTAAGNDDFTKRYSYPVEQISARVGALVAIDGDSYFGFDDTLIIRNGEVWRKKLQKGMDLCVLYRDGRMETKKWGTFTLDDILSSDPWQVWSFGPALLDEDGHSMDIKHNLAYGNPRAAIGYYEPGHYCFVIVDGRQPGYSEGMRLNELSRLMEDLGCKAAYNLDGGASAEMYWVDGIISRGSSKTRTVSDIIYLLPEGMTPAETDAETAEEP